HARDRRPAAHEPHDLAPRPAGALPAGRGRRRDLQGLRERRHGLPDRLDRRDRGPASVPAVARARRVHAPRPHDRVPPVHRHAERDVLELDPDRDDDDGRLLDQLRRPLRGREVVPGPRDDDAHRLTLPRPELLPRARARARRLLVLAILAERDRARARPRPAPRRDLPGRRRPRGLRVPRPTRTTGRPGRGRDVPSDVKVRAQPRSRSPMRCTCIEFVVPGTPTGAPETTTTRSPCSARPFARSVWSTWPTISSEFATRGTW